MNFKYKGWIVALFLVLQSSLSTQDGINQQQTQHMLSLGSLQRQNLFSICPDSYTEVQGQAITCPSAKGSAYT